MYPIGPSTHILQPSRQSPSVDDSVYAIKIIKKPDKSDPLAAGLGNLVANSWHNFAKAVENDTLNTCDCLYSKY